MTTKASTLSLYRSILRLHSKSLPMDMRSLGDAYVKAEFKLHKNVTDQNQLHNFFSEWKKYLIHIQEAVRARDSREAGLVEKSMRVNFGVKMDDSIEMNNDQKIQLEKLKEEATKQKDS